MSYVEQETGTLAPAQHSTGPAERTVPWLSNELTSRIIDYLHDDTPSLKNCTLTCRCFLQRSRYNIFRCVSLNLRNSQKFAKLLEASPVIGPCVRELHVTVSAVEQHSTWVDKLLPLMSLKMPSVTELHLKGKGMYRAAPLQGLQSLKTIHILGCEIESINEFCTIMSSFPRLKTMITNEMFVYRSKEITVKNTARPSNFSSLVFNSARVDPEMLGDWMIRESIHINLEYFACCPVQQVGVPPVAKLLTAMGTSLKHLKIALIGLVAQGGFIDLLEENCTLTWNLNLRILEFGSPAAYSALYGADDLSFAWFPTLLGQVNSAVIETVGFYLWEGDLDGISSNAWDNIVHVLSSEQFIPLKKIAFHVWGDPVKAASIVKAVKMRFASFDERGLLHIDDVADPAC